MLSPSQYEGQALFELQVAGYVPVIAHFERYPYYHGNFQKVAELRERNIKIQVNLGSLSGHYGGGIQKMAEELIQKGLVDFLGSDCHRMEHLWMIEAHLSLPIFDLFTHRLYRLLVCFQALAASSKFIYSCR